MPNEPTLPDCPFCSEPADIEASDEGTTVACLNTHCWIFGFVIDVESWSRRAHSPAVRELIEAAKEYMRQVCPMRNWSCASWNCEDCATFKEFQGKRLPKAIAAAEREGKETT